MTEKFKPGDRVYYRDNGPEDIGTVVSTSITTKNEYPMAYVTWDDHVEDGEYWQSQLESVREMSQ